MAGIIEGSMLAGPVPGIANRLTHAWPRYRPGYARVMADLIAARDWLTVYRLPRNAHELNAVEPV